jgi:hypothetical protein
MSCLPLLRSGCTHVRTFPEIGQLADLLNPQICVFARGFRPAGWACERCNVVLQNSVNLPSATLTGVADWRIRTKCQSAESAESLTADWQIIKESTRCRQTNCSRVAVHSNLPFNLPMTFLGSPIFGLQITPRNEVVMVRMFRAFFASD